MAQRLRASPIAITGGALLLLLITMAVFAPCIAPWEPQAQDLGRRLVAPTWLAGP